MLVEMGQQASQPQWLRTMLRRLAAREARFHRRDADRFPTAAVRARVRSVLAARLGSFCESGDGCDVVVTAELVRALDLVDAWIESIGAEQAHDALLRIESIDPVKAAGGMAELIAGVREQALPEHARLAGESIRRLQSAGVPRRAWEGASAAMELLNQSESEDVRREVRRSLNGMAESLSVPSWKGSGHFRSAIAVMDQRIYEDLERLSDHASWLAACDDTWSDPGAAVLMASLRHRAMRRRNLAMAAQQAIWSEAEHEVRDAMLRAAQDILAGRDDSRTHEQFASITEDQPRPQGVSDALLAIGWPSDPLDRLRWPGPARCRGAAGGLLMALVSRQWVARMRWTRRWQDACDQADAAAQALLACLDAPAAYHA